MKAALCIAALLSVCVPASASSGSSSLERLVSDVVHAAAPSGDLVTIQRTQLFVHKACKVRDAHVTQPLQSSGRVGVRLVGDQRASKAGNPTKRSGSRSCSGFAWAEVKLRRRALVLERSVDRGEALSAAVVHRVIDVQPGRQPMTELTSGAVASRKLKGGQTLMDFMVRELEAKPGAPVPVHILIGGIRMTVQGSAVRCGLHNACARLSSGKLVRGRAEGGAVIVEGGL